MIKVDIKTVWDDECGNIDYKGSKHNKSDVFKIKMTGGFKNWDALSKLDYFTDLENWMQGEINDVHKKSDPKESFVRSYIMGCPKSTEQFTADQDPIEYAKREQAVKELIKNMDRGGRRFNNVINFKTKKLESESKK